MALITPHNLYRIPFLVQGWTHLADRNFQRLDALYFRLNAIIDVDVTGIQDRDVLAWDSESSKWVVKRYSEIFPTTTTTTTTTTSSTSSTTSSTTTTSTTSTTTSSTSSTTSSTTTTSTTSTTTSSTTTTEPPLEIDDLVLGWSTTTTTTTSTSTTTTTAP